MGEDGAVDAVAGFGEADVEGDYVGVGVGAGEWVRRGYRVRRGRGGYDLL